MPVADRATFLEPLIVGSVKAAKSRGESFALVRPVDSRFRFKPKSPQKIEAERREYQAAVQQQSFLDEELAAIEPSPFEFKLSFRDEDGWHHHLCGDWETTAAFWKLKRSHSEERALEHLNEMYNEQYPQKGMALALGNMARRPQTWLLLGVIRLDTTVQSSLPI